MGMVIVGNKAFDLANVVLLELREPHGEDRYPYVAATFHGGQTIEVTSPMMPVDGTANAVMATLASLLANQPSRVATVATVHDVASFAKRGDHSGYYCITMKNGSVFERVGSADISRDAMARRETLPAAIPLDAETFKAIVLLHGPYVTTLASGFAL